MGHPQSFSFIFGLCKQALQILQLINVKICTSSLQCWDSNLQPSDYESPPLTTRPGYTSLLLLLCHLCLTLS